MKNLTPFSILILLFSNCSNEPSNPSPDIAYNLENVRVLVPREYKEVKSKEKVKEIGKYLKMRGPDLGARFFK